MRAWTLALCLAVSAVPGQAGCRLALALGLDVSGSVDAAEYALQMNGLANALLRPAVQEAILAFPEAPVRLYVFKWADHENQGTVLHWTQLNTPSDLTTVADVLRHSPRTSMAPATGLGAAMLFGHGALGEQRECWRRTLDISGDGKGNSGPLPRDVSVPGITVNGLVIGADPRSATDLRHAEIGELQAYYRAEVIRGPDAFTEVALGFEDFEEAMARKLLKELQVLAVADR